MPPLNARPDGLSVTQIEDLLRDPYTIYARHILKLRPLDAVDTPPGARDRGTVIHGAIGDFTEKYAKALPADPLDALLALGEARFAVLQDYPEARAFWWPRFQRIARWFVAWEAGRRADATALHAEVSARLPIRDRHAQLHAPDARRPHRAAPRRQLRDPRLQDRLDADRTTGAHRALAAAHAGRRDPARRARSRRSPARSISELAYVALRGGEPAGEHRPIEFKEGTPDEHADRALAMLRSILTRFADPDTPYRSLVSPMWKTRYGDYDHLARVKEWSAGGEEEEME